MNVGIIGAGHIGGAVGQLLARAGHAVLFSYSRDAAAPRRLAAAAGTSARAGTPRDAAGFGDAVLFAVPWTAVDDALAAAGPLAGRVVLDTTNPYAPDFRTLAVADDTSGGEQLAARMTGAHVVKAFNTLDVATLTRLARATDANRAALFYCGDDPGAKAVAARLIADAGFDGVDAGSMHRARAQEPPGPLYGAVMSAAQARAVLEGRPT